MFGSFGFGGKKGGANVGLILVRRRCDAGVYTQVRDMKHKSPPSILHYSKFKTVLIVRINLLSSPAPTRPSGRGNAPVLAARPPRNPDAARQIPNPEDTSIAFWHRGVCALITTNTPKPPP